MPQPKSCCHVCRKEDCKLLRCSGCRQVQYCSKTCQINDWKGGHRRLCSKNSSEPNQGDLEVKAHKAMLELQTILAGNHSLDTLAADRHKALDAVEGLRVRQSKSNRSKTPSKKSPPKPAPDQPTTKTKPIQINASSHWDFWMENLTHISCYQIALRPNHTQKQSIGSFSQFAEQLQISISFDPSHDSSTVVVRYPHKIPPELFSQLLPGKINPQPKSFQVFDNHFSLNLHLQYEPSLDQTASASSRTTTSTSSLNTTNANQLCCKYCHWNLIQPNARKIDRVVQMPSANWDDIADYLICYSGQATIDFTTDSTNAAQVGSILLDKSALLLHQQDVGSSVCVLAVEAYGQKTTLQPSPLAEAKDDTPAAANTTVSPFATAAQELGADAPAVVRGEREWCETVGGGSICCSQCCSVLGFASLSSPETYRFLNHRLVLPVDPDDAKNKPRMIPVLECASFVANEMVRYAETKAIFTFVVERNGAAVQPHTNPRQQDLLLLKLLSWDSQFVCSNGESSIGDASLGFQPSAKIIFEQVVMDGNTSNGRSSSDDPGSWIWGGVDLCCLPNAKTTTSTTATTATATTANSVDPNDSPTTRQQPPSGSLSSVRLLLEEDEWYELQESLRKSSAFFPEEVVQATVMAKLGKRSIPSSTESVGLSLILL